MPARGPLATLSTATALSLLLVGCTSSTSDSDDSASSGDTVTVEDNHGTQEVPVDPDSIVALDNGSFQTLSDWGVDLSAAAVSLMPDTIEYTTDESIIDIGNHNEPDLESIVAADPDLVVNGNRFAQYHDDIAELVPDAAIIDFSPREDEPFDEELKRQATALGEIFDKEDEAEELISDFEDSIEAVRSAYDSDQTVMAVNTSGGEIGYIAPSIGRTLGPVFDFAELTPALEVDGSSDDHQGDDISVEAIADASPDWILVMDRDAAVAADDPSYAPAAELLEESEALQGVPAVDEGQIVYMPEDTYTNESIQTYTTFLNEFAEALET